jgi:antitoxin component of MazEF toxin-antitoxin module
MKSTTKLRDLGGSRVVILPAIWLKQIESDGQEITDVELDMNESCITITPIKNQKGGNQIEPEQSDKSNTEPRSTPASA